MSSFTSPQMFNFSRSPSSSAFVFGSDSYSMAPCASIEKNQPLRRKKRPSSESAQTFALSFANLSLDPINIAPAQVDSLADAFTTVKVTKRRVRTKKLVQKAPIEDYGVPPNTTLEQVRRATAGDQRRRFHP